MASRSNSPSDNLQVGLAVASGPSGVQRIDVYNLIKDRINPRLKATADHRVLLVGRLLGSELKDRLLSCIEKTGAGEIVILDLSKVVAHLDVIEEVVGHLVCEKEKGHAPLKERLLFLLNPDQATKYAIHCTLVRELDCSMVLETTEDECRVSYVGQLQPYLTKILRLMVEKGSCTSKLVVDTLKMKVNDAGNRLKQLAEDGLALRQAAVTDQGRLNFVYTPAASEAKKLAEVVNRRFLVDFYQPNY